MSEPADSLREQFGGGRYVMPDGTTRFLVDLEQGGWELASCAPLQRRDSFTFYGDGWTFEAASGW